MPQSGRRLPHCVRLAVQVVDKWGRRPAIRGRQLLSEGARGRCVSTKGARYRLAILPAFLPDPPFAVEQCIMGSIGGGDSGTYWALSGGGVHAVRSCDRARASCGLSPLRCGHRPPPCPCRGHPQCRTGPKAQCRLIAGSACRLAGFLVARPDPPLPSSLTWKLPAPPLVAICAALDAWSRPSPPSAALSLSRAAPHVGALVNIA